MKKEKEHNKTYVKYCKSFKDHDFDEYGPHFKSEAFPNGRATGRVCKKCGWFESG